MNAIEAHHIRKSYGPVTAVDDVSLTVRDGEIFGFLGPNGAGKTTTTRILTGIIPPDGGNAAVLGHDIRTAKLLVKRRSFIFSGPGNSDSTARSHIHRTMVFLHRRWSCRGR